MSCLTLAASLTCPACAWRACDARGLCPPLLYTSVQYCTVLSASAKGSKSDHLQTLEPRKPPVLTYGHVLPAGPPTARAAVGAAEASHVSEPGKRKLTLNSGSKAVSWQLLPTGGSSVSAEAGAAPLSCSGSGCVLLVGSGAGRVQPGRSYAIRYTTSSEAAPAATAQQQQGRRLLHASTLQGIGNWRLPYVMQPGTALSSSAMHSLQYSSSYPSSLPASANCPGACCCCWYWLYCCPRPCVGTCCCWLPACLGRLRWLLLPPAAGGCLG